MNEITKDIQIYTEAQYLAQKDGYRTCVVLYPYLVRDLTMPTRSVTAAMVIGLVRGIQVYHRIFEVGETPYSPDNWSYIASTQRPLPRAADPFAAVEEALRHVVAAEGSEEVAEPAF